MEENEKHSGIKSRSFTLEMLCFTIAVLSGMVLLGNIVSGNAFLPAMIIAGILFTLSVVMVIRLELDPDSVRARQSDAMLKLASQTLSCMDKGLNQESAHEICSLLLPATAAIAVAITDRENILAYVGYDEESFPVGSPIHTQATHEVLADGEGRILLSRDEIGLPSSAPGIKAAIIMPLTVGKEVKGALKFYYRSPKKVSETQKSIAQGLAELLSTQMAASALEEQTQLATRMELKMLQSQINPHFLFNTINTIASLIRTDPEKARKLLREFAVFYRSTLEDSADEIEFSRELEQTQRYFSFEVARFGEDRLELKVEVDPRIEKMMTPPFLLQPLVENAVRHALPSEGKLTITVTGEVEGDDVVVCVVDDGVGMTEETRQNILHPQHTEGMGIAMKNVHDRIEGYYGPGAYMDVESELGQGTCVKLFLKGAAAKAREASVDEEMRQAAAEVAAAAQEAVPAQEDAE